MIEGTPNVRGNDETPNGSVNDDNGRRVNEGTGCGNYETTNGSLWTYKLLIWPRKLRNSKWLTMENV